MSFTLDTFYRSKEWEQLRRVIIAERTKPDGFIYDEETGKPIVNAYDLILHHKVFLTEENVNDFEISLNPANIEVVSHKTHNFIHERLGASRKEIFLVYGPPLAGKTTWVLENKGPNDLVVDIDSLWEAITGKRYVKPWKLRSIAFRMRDDLLDAIKFRFGKWSSAYIIGGYASAGERERLAQELGARLVFIEATQDECLTRLANDTERDAEEWSKYIFDWFDLYGDGSSTPPTEKFF